MNRADHATPVPDSAYTSILSVMPSRERDVRRLQQLMIPDCPPVVTVVGKYNHGKSRLLNEMIGSAIFSVADRRETVALSGHDDKGIRWLDAPGVDADVSEHDDALARQAIWIQSDVRLFVHAAREGELDASECALLQDLATDEQESERRTLLVLSQIDQVSDREQLDRITGTIASQMPASVQYPVSATRYRQGIDSEKPLLVERSGLPALQAALNTVLEQVPAARTREAHRRLEKLRDEIARHHAACQAQLVKLEEKQRADRQAFERDLTAVQLDVQEKLADIVRPPEGKDPALEPDTFETAFKLTEGKKERNRLQVAYSRACIAIDAVLIRHGVTGIPADDHVQVANLNSVIVAVFGISVKYRADLRQIFCEEAGRQKAHQDFCRFFERSDDRRKLQAEIEASRQQVRAAEQALNALDTLESSL